NTYDRYVCRGAQPVLQAILPHGAGAKTGSLQVVGFLAWGGKHNNTQYQPRDNWHSTATARLPRGSILSSKGRLFCGRRCGNGGIVRLFVPLGSRVVGTDSPGKMPAGRGGSLNLP